MTWIVEPLDANLPNSHWLRPLSRFEHAFALESYGAEGQRFDILSANPRLIISSSNGNTHEIYNNTRTLLDCDPFTAIEQRLAEVNSTCPIACGFTGGAVGYFGYELAHQLEKLPDQLTDDTAIPDLIVGIYDWFICRDHLQNTLQLVFLPHVTEAFRLTIKHCLFSADDLPLAPFIPLDELQFHTDKNDYLAAIQRIDSYIQAGDCYQVNFTQKLSIAYQGDPLEFYTELGRRQRAPFSAWLKCGETQILSFSPERFIQVCGHQALTQPIKGTRRRGKTPEEDQQLAEELRASEKDRAENLMIVDLLRNDFGRCCHPGSINVDSLFELRSFTNVHHLVSTISGDLDPRYTALDLLKACFPGGSITGAPKVRAMQLITELESNRRHVYCGAIGYYGFNGDMDTNLAIRTMVCKDKVASYWGGGGIVADSSAAAEYAESLEKVDFITEQLLARQSLIKT